MVLYLCHRCGYETKHKGSFVTHVNRKNICKPILDDISIKTIIKMYNLDVNKKSPQFTTKNHNLKKKNDENCEKNAQKNLPQFTTKNHKKKKILQKSPQFYHNLPQFSSSNRQVCEYCKGTFSRLDSLHRHYKICRIKNKNKVSDKDKQIEQLVDVIKDQNERIKDHEKEKAELIEVMKEQMKETVENLIIDMSNKDGGGIGNTHTVNNNNYNYTNYNTINNTIHINNYGCENINYLDKDYLNNLLEGAFTALPKLIENIHFNPEHPENHNIKITNKKQPFVKVLKNDQWHLQDKQETLDHLLDEKYYMLETHYAKLEEKEKLTGKMEEVMGRFRERYTGDKDLQKKLNKDTELIILNNGEQLKQ